MKREHLPTIDGRYWAGITLASVFGTNLGDLYAHDSGLGIVGGLALLAVLAGLAFVAERRDPRTHEAWYWLAILVIRTGATNIADFLAFRARIPAVLLAAGLIALYALLSWRTHAAAARERSEGGDPLPATDAVYWAAMLTAGVLGTVLGDDLSHLIGVGTASAVLGAALMAVLVLARGRARTILAYWAIIALARTAGTAIGDWIAERRGLDLGLPLACAITGAAFVAVLVLLRSRTLSTRTDGVTAA